MGIDSLLQQNAGLAGIDRMAGNAMYPQSQMDKTQYAVSSQMPTSAAVMKADYEPLNDPLTGTLTQSFAYGGIARYDGEEGSVVTEEPINPVLTNPDFKNLDLSEENLPVLTELYSLKETDPKAYNAGLMSVLSNQLKTQYNKNENYEPTWYQLKSLEKADPAQWHKHQLDFLGHQQGWQIGQNTSERNAAGIPVIQDEIEQAKKAGVSEEEIQQILANSEQSGNYQNQRRIAQDAASAKGGNFGELAKVAAPMALSMIAAPYLAPMLAPTLGTLGATIATGALTGATTAGITGGNVGRGALMGGASGALGGALKGIDPSVAQGVNLAKNAYSLSQNPRNPVTAINAFKGISSLAPVNAAQGGLMASGGITTLGSYSDGGRLLKGPGDGMSDNIPATIANRQPARLADGEFVIPADVVSHLGNGSTDAGAKQLYKMMDRIRHARTGNKKQGKRINPNKYLPKG
jgi:hypothetical protein